DDTKSDTEMPERHVSPTPHDAMLSRCRSRVVSRSSSPTIFTLKIPTAPILPAPSAVVTLSTNIISPVNAPLGIQTLAAYEANHVAELAVESQSQNGDDDDNRNAGGNGNKNGKGNRDRNGGGNGNGNRGGNGNGNPNRNDRGVVGLTRWFTKMETVFYISNCPERYQVKYATCTLLNSALTWWNAHKRTIGADVAFDMSRRELKKLTTERFQEQTMMCTKMVLGEEDRVDKFIGGLSDNI
nr:hypothetical protein [Tanacetum cinerariifolium]